MTELSKEYAEALFELAAETERVDAVGEALVLVLNELDTQKDFAAMLRCPAISRAERLKSIENVYGNRVPDIMLAMLKMMCQKGHIGLLKKVCSEYEMLSRRHKGIMLVNITSAVKLTEDEKAKLKDALDKRFGRQTELRCTVDPALIGGIRAEAEGNVIDGTIKYKLQQIKEVMDT